MLTALHSAQFVGVVALLIVLRDMGNGVIRIEVAKMLEHFRPDTVAHPDFVALPSPFSPRVADSIEAALGGLGVKDRREFTEARARSVCDRITELYVW